MAGALGVPELSPDGLWIACIDTGNNLLRVVTLSDGAEVVTIALPPSVPLGLLALGRSRWIPGSSTPRLARLRLRVHGDAPRRAGDRPRPRHERQPADAPAGTPDSMPESFAVSPDGSRLLVSFDQSRSDILLVDGLRGVAR